MKSKSGIIYLESEKKRFAKKIKMLLLKIEEIRNAEIVFIDVNNKLIKIKSNFKESKKLHKLKADKEYISIKEKLNKIGAKIIDINIFNSELVKAKENLKETEKKLNLVKARIKAEKKLKESKQNKIASKKISSKINKYKNSTGGSNSALTTISSIWNVKKM